MSDELIFIGKLSKIKIAFCLGFRIDQNRMGIEGIESKVVAKMGIDFHSIFIFSRRLIFD